MEDERRVLPLVRKPRGLEEEGELAVIYRACYPALVRYAIRLVGREDAEDVVQDAFVKFLTQRGKRRAEGDAYDARVRLMVMVKDEAIDHLRAQQRRSRLELLISGSTAAIRRWTRPTRPVYDQEILEQIHAVLAKHGERQWLSMWILMREQDVTTAEAAAVLGVKEKTVSASLCRANALLREHLPPRGLSPEVLGEGRAP